MDADVNAGVRPDQPAWIDTREGSFYWDMTQVCALEIARLWDALGSESVAVAFPTTAWGGYLDEHAATFGLVRNAAIPATGFVLFVGKPDTLIGQNVQVSADPSDPSLDTLTFQTTASGVIGPELDPPTNVVATLSEVAGLLLAGTYVYHVTAYNEFGETLGSANAPVTVVTDTGRVSLTWDAVSGATGYRVYRGPGGLGSLIQDLNDRSFVDAGNITPTALEPTENTTAGVRVPVVALQAGAIGNLGANAVSNLDTRVPDVVYVTNEAATTGGADVEDDEALRLRVLAQYAGQGGGNQNDYVKWSLTASGVERCVCIPVPFGPQTVLVIPMRSDGSPVASTVVSNLQTLLDPDPAQGGGLAPIGALVTVATTVALAVTVSASLVFAHGFTLDGLGGTVATRAEILTVLQELFVSLDPGGTVGYQQIQAKFFEVDGVRQVNGLTVNGGVVDIPLSLTPPQYADMQTPVLS